MTEWTRCAPGWQRMLQDGRECQDGKGTPRMGRGVPAGWQEDTLGWEEECQRDGRVKDVQGAERFMELSQRTQKVQDAKG